MNLVSQPELGVSVNSDMPESPVDAKAFWDERYAEDVSSATAGHVTLGQHLNEWCFRVRRQVVRRLLAQHEVRPDRSRIVELAFGAGAELTTWAQHNAPFVLGFEISQRAVDFASKKYASRGWQFRCRDITKPCLDAEDEGAFDMAVAIGVVFMLVDDNDWRRSIETLCEAVKPGGHVLLTDHLEEGAEGINYIKMRPLSVLQEEFRKHNVEILAVRPTTFFLSTPHASAKWANIAWRVTGKIVRVADRFGLREPVGFVLGAIYYLPDLALTRFKNSGPGAHVILARRIS